MIRWLLVFLLGFVLLGSLLSATHKLAEMGIERDRLQDALTVAHTAAEQDRARYAAQQVRMATLDAQIKDLRNYASTIPDGDAACLPPADVERLRGLWE